MFVVPKPTTLPASGLWVMVNALLAVQLSLAVTLPVKSGTLPWQLPLALLVCGGAQLLIVGAVVSLTVKLV